MADINDICSEIVRNVDGALGCAVVDLNSGLLLGVSHNVPYFTQSYLDAVAAAAVDMFRGRTVTAVEDMISNMRGSPKKHMIKEVQMTTDNTMHFMIVIPDKPNSLVVLVTSKKVNLGMGWSSLRMAIPKLNPLCP
ncbi:hypothetical protein [Beggiatoa leptomitoformis]|uniref:Roadblock/LAMTOR2 domain-containing protein n=1 Tax=Beggiatoa leptomitoformis TaxID=288004 RepID=A0A2N9YII6_9GAMM|nr:hypothetical protein [Beggiatoa leptomitoformis]ALG67485.1 hypothetical protein AL038_06950 [Beggiatoa leptomitoformis]AUI70293.1 hypothetical protein BLE401_17360 [Beggiatoa leptomitoformis]